MTIGERIAYLRQKRGLTQSALAELLGVSDKAVSKWERGISRPEVTILSDLSSALGVTADELIRDGDEPIDEPDVRFISLEKYLRGDFGYYVPDLHPVNEEVTLVMDSPELDDTERGYALSGKVGTIIKDLLYDGDGHFGFDELRMGKLGVTYVANVPLGNLKYPITKIMGELEYTRLNKYHVNLLLLEGVIKKLERLVLSDTVRVIALTREFNKKYLGAFISHADNKTLAVMQNKIATGALRLIFVGNPRFWNTGNPLTAGDYKELKKYI